MIKLRDIDWRRVALLSAPVPLLTAALALSPVADIVDAGVVRPVEFRARHLIGRDPKLDPRLRLYALDDAAAAFLEAPEPSLATWARILAYFGSAKLRLLYLDDPFVTPSGGTSAQSFTAAAKKLPFPLAVPVLVETAPLPGREPLDPSRTELGLGPDRAGHLPVTDALLYGPDPRVLSAGPRLGERLSVGPSGSALLQGYVRPAPGAALPHVAWHALPAGAAGTVPLDGRGRFLANLSGADDYRDRLFSLKNVLQRISRNEPPVELPDGAVVAILTGFRAGSPRLATTPLGTLPEAFLTVAALNSALSGEWLVVRGSPVVAALVGGAAGAVMAACFAGSSLCLAALSAALLGLFGLGLSTFAFQGVALPWLSGVIGLAGAALCVHADYRARAARRAAELRAAFDGALPEARVEALLARAKPPSLAPRERTVTILFLDIVGFSAAAESLTPEETFAALKRLLGTLSEIIHRYGGVVDKALGDGLLCHFGYGYEDGESAGDHADQAVRCAIEIQTTSLHRDLEAKAKGEPVHPIRIGINTARVYVGALGLGNEGRAFRLELALLGHGVNYAKRLESACDSYCVMLGAATRDALVTFDRQSDKLKKRFVQLKHLSELIEAYELDPFQDNPELKARAIAAYREFAGIQRKETRFDVPPSRTVEVFLNGDWARARLENFSESGLALRCERYLGRGVTLSVSLDDALGLGDKLQRLGLAPLAGEVKWGRPLTEGHSLLGIQLTGLGARQREALVQTLREHFAIEPRRTGTLG